MKVFDQYLNFISLEDDMYCLRHQESDSISYYGQFSVGNKYSIQS